MFFFAIFTIKILRSKKWSKSPKTINLTIRDCIACIRSVHCVVVVHYTTLSFTDMTNKVAPSTYLSCVWYTASLITVLAFDWVRAGSSWFGCRLALKATVIFRSLYRWPDGSRFSLPLCYNIGGASSILVPHVSNMPVHEHLFTTYAFAYLVYPFLKLQVHWHECIAIYRCRREEIVNKWRQCVR